MKKEETKTTKPFSIDSVVKRKWANLDDDLIFILGRPNFVCGGMARRMREIGYECKEKAEVEQAMVIHTMLKFYTEYGSNWKAEFSKHLKGE